MWRRYLRPSVLVGHVLVLAAALTCLRLGWWQWDVTREARGTVQNLGYALLWPVFAGSFIYMWLRFLHLESVRDGDDVPGDAAAVTAGQVDARASSEATLIPPEQHAEPESDAEPETAPTSRDDRPRRGNDNRRGYTVAVATVGDDEDDPELAAYNQALAALAEQDERGAR